MRKVILVCGMIASLCFPAKVSAQRNELDRRDVNERIEALRSRLDEFRNNKIQQVQGIQEVRENREPEPVIVERIEESFEKISVELENRNDVAVVVLFKDTDYSVDTATMADSVDEKPASRGVTVPLSIYESNRQQEDIARKERYDELRRRVFLATRRTQNSATELRQLVANIR